MPVSPLSSINANDIFEVLKGVGIAGIAIMTAWNRRATKKVNAELTGGEKEPSLRQMAKDIKTSAEESKQAIAAHHEEYQTLFSRTNFSIDAHHTEYLKSFKTTNDSVLKLSDSVDNLNSRQSGLESAVYSHMEERVKALEDSARDSAMIRNVLTAQSELTKNLMDRMRRAEMNMHKLAAPIQVKLFSEEEARIQASQMGPEGAK